MFGFGYVRFWICSVLDMFGLDMFGLDMFGSDMFGLDMFDRCYVTSINQGHLRKDAINWVTYP